MLEYSHENSLTFGYGDGVLNEKQGNLTFKLQRCSREPAPLAFEFARTAELLGAKAAALGRPIYLLQSGGLDSEVMIKSFMLARVPFKTITFRFPNALNSHELQYVRRFSEREKLETQMYDLDVLRWLESTEAREFFHLSNCHEASMLPHMKLLQHVWFKLGGMPVLGGGDAVILKENGQWLYSKYEYMLAWYWFCRKMGIDAGVAFFQHTPEVILAMLREPAMVKAASGHDQYANKLLPDLRAVKYKIYHQHWPALERRIKFGGGELIYAVLQKAEAKWRAERALTYNSIWSIPYAEAVRVLSPSSAAAAVV